VSAKSEWRLVIAGVRLIFRADTGVAIEAPKAIYSAFIEDRHPGAEGPDIDVRVSAAALPDLGAASTLFDTGDAWSLLADGDTRYLRLSPSTRPREPLWIAATDDDFRRVRLFCGDPLIHRSRRGTLVRHLIQYPIDQILLVQRLIGQQGMLVHAAGAVTPQGGYLFAGPSGAGKSTLTRLLGSRQMFRFLSDDRIVLRVMDGHTRMFGTPWPGDAQVAESRGAPLAGICFLNHGAKTRLQRLNPASALKRLLPVASIPWYDREATHQMLSFCERLLERYPAYELDFRPAEEELLEALSEFSLAA
jgi:hypothetical protein